MIVIAILISLSVGAIMGVFLMGIITGGKDGDD